MSERSIYLEVTSHPSLSRKTLIVVIRSIPVSLSLMKEEIRVTDKRSRERDADPCVLSEPGQGLSCVKHRDSSLRTMTIESGLKVPKLSPLPFLLYP